jgi:hypothetical protein
MWRWSQEERQSEASEILSLRKRREPSSPSPQPSPLGRGGIFASRSANRRLLGFARAERWCSLSPRERVGVRGKKTPSSESGSGKWHVPPLASLNLMAVGRASPRAQTSPESGARADSRPLEQAVLSRSLQPIPFSAGEDTDAGLGGRLCEHGEGALHCHRS